MVVNALLGYIKRMSDVAKGKPEEQLGKELLLWEQKKNIYGKQVQPILKKWASRFDALASGYLEDIRLGAVAQFDDIVIQQKVNTTPTSNYCKSSVVG